MATGTTSPDLSVFVPCFNHGRYVAQTLRSIFRQTLPPSRLLVIDDGSTDDSAKVIERTLADCPFESEFISRPNRGLSATLNEGFERLSGKYFAYIGSDDLWLPDFLEARVSLLESAPDAVLAHGNAYVIDGNSKVIENSADYNTYVNDEARPLLDRSTAPISSTVCYRRAALEKHSWNEQSRLEDLELYLFLSYDGRFAFDPAVRSTWRMHDSNASRDFEWMLAEALAAQRRVAKSLGLPTAKLRDVEAKTSMEYALLFARRGASAKALDLLLKHWWYVPGGEKPLKIFGHFLLPQFVRRMRARRKDSGAGFQAADRLISEI